jgi:hypothetical protein
LPEMNRVVSEVYFRKEVVNKETLSSPTTVQWWVLINTNDYVLKDGMVVVCVSVEVRSAPPSIFQFGR